LAKLLRLKIRSKRRKGGSPRYHHYRRKSARRSRAAVKGWDTRIRKEGVRQLIKVPLSYVNPINKVRTVKDLSLGLVKVTKPGFYRKSGFLKWLDKI